MTALSIRKVLSLLVLVCVPAMAIIPADIDLQLGGAQQLSNFEYSVKGGQKVSLTVTAKPHSEIFAFAMPLDDQSSVLLPLLHEKDSASGTAYAELKVPVGVSGVFQVQAFAISAEGDELYSAILWVEVVAAPKNDTGEPSLVLW